MTGAVVGGTYLNTDSGLNAPGGLFDRLLQAADARAQNQGVLEGLGPALRATGVPVAAPQGVFGTVLNRLGLGSQNQPTAQGGPASAASPAPAASASPTASSSGANPEVVNYITSAAQARGIAPNVALGAAAGEGLRGFDPNGKPNLGDGGSSAGPYQLHYGGVAPGGNAAAGLGDDFTAATGLDARDPSTWKAQVDFALDHAAKYGWGAFHGAAKVGIGVWTGIGQAPAQGAGAATPTQVAQNGASDAYDSSDAATTSTHPYAPVAPASQPPVAPAPASTQVTGNPNASQRTADGSGNSSASPGQVLQPLMANPATREVGSRLWQGSLQQGGGTLPSAMTLPPGMTPDALAAMISTPQTMQMGLAIWQKALFPQITTIKPGETIMRGAQIIGQAPSGPMDVGPGHTVVNPNNGTTVAAVPPELQRGEVGRDAYGQPTYGAFNPGTGAVTPFAATPGTTSGAATGPDGQPLTGDAFLGSLPPAIADQVKAIADGRVKLPSGMGATSPMAQRLRAAVLQYDPSFDQAGVDARFETRADFAKGDAAKTITAGNTALIHLGELSSLADKLGNADTSIPGNNVYNAAKNYANSSSAAGAPLAAFNATVSKYVEEATKFYRGTGGTESDINRDMLNLSPNMSPTQIKAAIGAQIPLIQGKVDAMQSRWHQGMGPQAGDYPIMSPQAQAVLNRLGPQASADSDPASASVPVAAPAGGGAAAAQPPASAAAGGPVDQARAAIARGAPRAAVIQRLQQMGVNVSGTGL